MSIQEEENYNIDIKKHVSIKKEKDKTDLSPLEVNRHDYNVISYSNNFSQNNIVSRNSENSVNYQQIIKKTMKEIKYNFMEEHKNILNTYYSIYSKRLDDIISYNLNNSKIMKEYSNTSNEINRYQMINQTDTTTTRIIDEIIDKNIDTFLKSIEFAQKFYSDVIQSYYNYIMNINKSSNR
jgi:hypothetical protein